MLAGLVLDFAQAPFPSLGSELSLPPLAAPNHGPGTSGGGSSTASGETLRQGRFDLSLRLDWTEFEPVSRAEAERRARSSGEFDALRRGFVGQAALAYGVSDDLQLAVQTGYYRGSRFLDAESDGASTGSAVADPAGLTDTWLQAKYRLLRGPEGHLAVLGGVKLPTGRDDVRLSNGERLEPSSQPGSGSWDYQGGLAYSRYLSVRLALDASALYTMRTAHEGFAVGDRLDLGSALNYRLTESVQSYPQWSVFGEALFLWLGRDQEDGVANPNSGGAALFLSPGLRLRSSPSLSFTLAPSFPVVQDWNGDQVETRFKLALQCDVSF